MRPPLWLHFSPLSDPPGPPAFFQDSFCTDRRIQYLPAGSLCRPLSFNPFYEVQLTLEQHGGWSINNLQSALCTHSSYTSVYSTNPGPCHAMVFIIEKYPRMSGPLQFTPTLFNGQLFLLWGWCYARQKSTWPQSSRARRSGLTLAVWLPQVTAPPQGKLTLVEEITQAWKWKPVLELFVVNVKWFQAQPLYSWSCSWNIYQDLAIRKKSV